MIKRITVLDLFSGCWGLTEGFFDKKFEFIGHIEMDKSACETLKSRIVSKYLQSMNKDRLYEEFLIWKLWRQEIIDKLWIQKEIEMVYNEEISDRNYTSLLKKVKNNLRGKNLDLIIGWPPCQTYSQIGRSRIGKKIEKDPRNLLYKQYVKFLKDLKPKMFIFENVPGLKTAGQWKYLEDIENAIQKVWYVMEAREQYMPDYWIPQNRKRLIIIWWRRKNAKINKYLDLEAYKISEYKYVVNDFLSDLPIIKHWGWTEVMEYIKDNKILKKLGIRNKYSKYIIQHITRPIRGLDREIYKIAVEKYNKGEKLKYIDLPKHLITHKNIYTFQNRFNVVAGNHQVTNTIVAHISKDGHYYIHPDIKQNRSLSLREAARLQTFPDDFKFEWSRTDIFRQIGNAVPPMFSKILANEVVNTFL